MKTNTLLIVGLGNPGENYALTRHNVGFMFLDYLTKKHKLDNFNNASKLHSHINIYHSNQNRNILLKPQTFMNNSGLSVRATLDFYKLNIKNLIVIHDELDIKFGEYKISKNKNASGHNGILSIINHIGTKDFIRIRIGIDNRTQQQRKNQRGSEYVLGKFNNDELNLLPEIFEKIQKDDRLSIKEEIKNF